LLADEPAEVADRDPVAAPQEDEVAHEIVAAVGGRVVELVNDGRRVGSQAGVAQMSARKLIPSSICTFACAWKRARSSIVGKMASGTRWKASSAGGRLLTPGISGNRCRSKDTTCCQMPLMPGKRAGSVT
jgi:hypothetical protein